MALNSVFFRASKIALLSLVIVLTACSNTPPPANPPNLTQGKLYINQVAFDVRSPKQAVLSLPLDETATRFMVHQDNSIVYQGKLIPQPNFSDWGDQTQFYIADFSGLIRRGEFHIVVNTEKQQIKSSPFTIKPNAYFSFTAKSLLNYFQASRHTDTQDKAIRITGTEKTADVYGGWSNSGGDHGKQLSSQSQSNFLTPQQGAFAVWAMSKSYLKLHTLYDRHGLTTQLANEVMWGADYVHRLLSADGYFYSNISDNRGTSDERLIIGDGDPLNDNNYQAAYREGAGISIAALVNAYEVSIHTHRRGKISPKEYLYSAQKAFTHLQKHNLSYLNDGKENIIDDYTALIAATALYRVTKQNIYLKEARNRARNLSSRLTVEGWFISDSNNRPYYHNTDAGLPVIALVDYLKIEPRGALRRKAQLTIKTAIDYHLALNNAVSNPFNLARQTFTPYVENQQGKKMSGFFMPHANEANNWRGENARLASLTAATIWGGKYSHGNINLPFGVKTELGLFAQSQIDWIMGKNPYQMSMLYGFGIHNPPHAVSAGNMFNGGISNGITGATSNHYGMGITWAEGPDENNWRWTEQCLENTAWYLLAITAMVE